jgi:lincosamide nucleotidyltransferase A/C/D/E
MTAAEVIELYQVLTAAGIVVWIDGGWGVDALLGRQTRPHSDLDIAVQQKDVPALQAMLEQRGYRDVPRDDSSELNFVLGDDHGRLVDVHVVVLDESGKVIGGLAYPTDSLTGTGAIAGRIVRCIEARHMVKFHTGYKIRQSDRLDVTALCEQFHIEPPEEYR